MTDAETRFVEATVRRRRLFLFLSAVGVAAGLGLAGWYRWAGWTATHAVVVVLVLLNARQHLRQHRRAAVLDKLHVI